MSTAPAAHSAPAQADEAASASCSVCGSGLDADQEWCLGCGVARTVMAPPPDWRVPVLVIGVVVLGALVAFAIALGNLGSGSTSPPNITARTSDAAPGGSGAPIASWPPGQDGWTVVLSRSRSEAASVAAAQRQAAVGISVGVLNSSQHPLLRPGYWIVFSNRYPDHADAAVAAARWRAVGRRNAVALEVAAPGGI